MYSEVWRMVFDGSSQAYIFFVKHFCAGFFSRLWLRSTLLRLNGVTAKWITLSWQSFSVWVMSSSWENYMWIEIMLRISLKAAPASEVHEYSVLNNWMPILQSAYCYSEMLQISFGNKDECWKVSVEFLSVQLFPHFQAVDATLTHELFLYTGTFASSGRSSLRKVGARWRLPTRCLGRLQPSPTPSQSPPLPLNLVAIPPSWPRPLDWQPASLPRVWVEKWAEPEREPPFVCLWHSTLKSLALRPPLLRVSVRCFMLIARLWCIMVTSGCF